MDTISNKLARFAIELDSKDIPDQVVHEAKRFLLDTLGCAIGGYHVEDCKIIRELTAELGGSPQSTIIGSGVKTSCPNAALVNSLMVRALDFNDIYWGHDPSHPSDIIPAALAVGEFEHVAGADLITAIVLGYELEVRLCNTAIPGLRGTGWHHATLTQLVSPIVAGKMLGLNEENMVNSIGISGSHNATLGEVTTGKLTMMKNTVDPLAVQSGVVAALLAKKGFTGPATIFEGKQGVCRTIASKCDLKSLTEGLGKEYKITTVSMKAYPSEFLTHSAITATLRLVKNNNIKIEDVDAITVQTTKEAVEILADPSKYRPESKETADHSLPYCVVAAILYGTVGPVEFTQERIENPEVSKLIGKVEVKHSTDLEKLFPALQPTIVKIRTRRGLEFSCRVDYPKGSPHNRMTDQEVRNKFKTLASKMIGERQIGEIIKAVYNIEQISDIEELMALLHFQH